MNAPAQTLGKRQNESRYTAAMSAVSSSPIALLLGAVLLIAPLFQSGKTPLALLALELLALALLMCVLWRPERLRALPALQKAALAGLVLLPLLYLVPLPPALAALAPGRADHVAALALATDGRLGAPRTLSLYPLETLSGLLKLLLPVAVFLAASVLPTRRLQQLALLVTGMAGVQAVLGLLQYGGGLEVQGLVAGESSAVGTYTSRNNFAGFLLLALMPVLALLVLAVGRREAGAISARQRVAFWSSVRGHRAFGHAALALLLLLGIVFSRSRAGIALTMLGVVLVAVLLSRRIGGRSGRFGPVGAVASMALGLAVAIGLAPVLQRFTLQDPAADGRWTIFAGTLDGIARFFPVGAGPGTFQEAFFPFQDSAHAAYLINQAHNSYLEWVFDGGLPALLLVATLLFVYVARWFGLWVAQEWGEFRYLQVGCGLGLGLMLLHELVDYNLFVPANMVYFAFLAAVFLHDYREPLRARGRRESDDAEGNGERRLPPLPSQTSVPVTNPFMD